MAGKIFINQTYNKHVSKSDSNLMLFKTQKVLIFNTCEQNQWINKKYFKQTKSKQKANALKIMWENIIKDCEECIRLSLITE